MATSIQPTRYQPPQAIDSVSQAGGNRSRIRQDVQALSTALQSSDLQTAQQSYGDLQKVLQGNGSISQGAAAVSSPTPTGTLDTIKSDFAALGQALQSGDLAGAQKDYAQLATDSQKLVATQGGSGAVEGHHHHHHGPPPADTDSNSSSSASTTPNTNAGSPQFVTAYKFTYQASFQGFSSSPGNLPTSPGGFGTYQINAYQDSFSSVTSTGNANGQNASTQAISFEESFKSVSYTAPNSSTPQVASQPAPVSNAPPATTPAPPSPVTGYQAVSFQESYQSVSSSSGTSSPAAAPSGTGSVLAASVTPTPAPTTPNSAPSSASSSPQPAESQVFKQLNDFFSNLTSAKNGSTGAPTGYQAISFQESFQSSGTNQTNAAQPSAYQFSFKASFDSVSYFG